MNIQIIVPVSIINEVLFTLQNVLLYFSSVIDWSCEFYI